jgi:hypothetical protein
MPRAGLEPTIRLLEQAKTVHALDRAVTANGRYLNLGNWKGVVK